MRIFLLLFLCIWNSLNFEEFSYNAPPKMGWGITINLRGNYAIAQISQLIGHGAVLEFR